MENETTNPQLDVDTSKQAGRTLEELSDIPFNKMTRTELIHFAEALHDDNLIQHNKVNELRRGYENLFAQNSEYKERYEKLRLAATQREQFYRDQITFMYKTSLLLKPMEVL